MRKLNKASHVSAKKAFSIRQLAKQHGFDERSKNDKRRSFEIAVSKK